MKHLHAALLVGALMLIPLAQANADFDFPPPDPDPVAQSDNSDHGGRKGKIDGAKAVTAALVCFGLNEGLDAVAGLPRPTFVRGIFRGFACNGIAAIIPVGGIGGGLVGGIFGKVGYETMFGVDGMITHTINGTWKCQPNDFRSHCAIWVQQHPVKVLKIKNKKKFAHRRRH
ncbi:MAG: hypothetical protein WC050_04440 [Candidatus Paceibacterota bacterium]